MTPPISINFKAQILFVEDEDVDLELDYDNAILEMYGYKPISITINARNDFNMEGYIGKLQCFCQSEAVDVRCPVITITHANSVVSGF